MRSEGTDEPRWITESMLLAIHARQIERYGGLQGVRDANVVHSSLARPMQKRAYEPNADLADLADLAADYLVGLARSQGFNDGNKRTALACALVFLALNGVEVQGPAEGLYALTMEAAAGRLDDRVAAAWLREHARR